MPKDEKTYHNIKIKVSQDFFNLVETKADKLGIPTTQYVKHLILKDIETEVDDNALSSGSNEGSDLQESASAAVFVHIEEIEEEV